MADTTSTNPLLRPSDAPFGAPRFDLFSVSDYMPAFKEAIDDVRGTVERIASCPEDPTLGNTVVPLEYAGALLDSVEQIFFNLLEADSTPEMEDIAEQVAPLLDELSLRISMDPVLFARVRAVYEECFGTGDPSAPLPDPDKVPRDVALLARDTYRSFTHGGASLEGEDKERFGKVVEELSLSTLAYSRHLLAATNAFTLHVEDEAGLEGLPEVQVEAARAAAQQEGLPGWVFTLHAPSYVPFLKHSARRDLREKMWRAYNSRSLGGGDGQDNVALVGRIASLRAEKARLLSYPTYADLALEGRMAARRDTVEEFLRRLLAPSLGPAREDVARIEEFAKRNGFEGARLEPWDFSYWAEKYKDATMALGDEVLRPYFPLEATLGAVLDLATTLYGITFHRRCDIPVYHPDVRVYEVRDGQGGHLALLYMDFFPRPSKRGGAWMTEFKGQYRDLDGVDHRPFISVVTNFTPPTGDTPSLLTHDEVTTLLHEFGHSLHGMLSRGTYPSQCGTNVARDFVELPSQIMENWAFEKQWLGTFARHYKTGEVIPDELVDKIVGAKNFLSAYYHVRQLQFGILDFAWHTLAPGDCVAMGLDNLDAGRLEAFEGKVLEPCPTLPRIAGSATSTAFSHIFSGGYSAGYYSYKWAEVLEADAFSLFEANGIFDRPTADSFRRNILERGSSEDEALLYRAFRGHDPVPEALLRKLGIIR